MVRGGLSVLLVLIALSSLGSCAPQKETPQKPRPLSASEPDQKPRVELILLGTGYPRPDNEHAGPASALLVDGHLFVIDAGRGVVMRLAGASIALKALDAVFLTHLHSDHTAGLPDLFNSSWQFGRDEAMQLYGPEGVEGLSKATEEFFSADIHYRRDLVERHPGEGAKIDAHIVRDGVIYEDRSLGLRVVAFSVDHRPIVPAFGYRFEIGSKVVVFSGDTRPTPNLIRFAKGADVLVQEAYLPEWFDKVDSREVASRLKSYHTSAEEAGEIASQAGVRTLVLTHLIPANEEKTFLARARKQFRGKIVVGRDLVRMGIGEALTSD